MNEKNTHSATLKDNSKTTKTKEKSKHTEYFCKASYMVGPSKKAMPSINF